jgi:hypothetical protein
MPEDLESILRRVASGELTPEDAEPLVAEAARSTEQSGEHVPPRSAEPEPGWRPGTGQRNVTLRVIENGRQVVQLRLPNAWATLAGSALPGLSSAHAERIREAIRAGEVGPILDVRDEHGDGVVISTE